MPVRQSAPLGAPIWIDLTTTDLDGAQRFYGAVFGWTFGSAGPEYGGYTDAFLDGRPVAGLMANDPQWGVPDVWTTYLHTADIRDTIAKAVAAGAQTCVESAEPMEIKDRGWMGMLSDPTGAFFGLWQPMGHRGYELENEHGAPRYHQLTTKDYCKALGFYRQTFDWQTQMVSDTDEFRYSTVLFNGKELAGVMDGSVYLAAGMHSTWTVFIGSDDVDTTLHSIVSNGGTVTRGAEDTPYGRLAAATDPTGAGFNLSSIQS